MSFYDDEASAEDSQPREYYVIAIGNPAPVGEITYIASGNRDIEISGRIYTAVAMARSEIGVAAAGQGKELSLILPVDHALVRRYLRGGVPPKTITVTVYRLQVTSGESETIWTGRVTSMAVDGRVAKFRIPSRATESMLRVIPSVTAGRQCPHILYDDMCRVSRSGSHAGLAHVVSTTVIYVDGRTVRVNLGNVARNGDWAVNGELYHEDSTERMSIRDQNDLSPGSSAVADLTLQMAIPGMAVGDGIQVYAGCDKFIETCNARFGNRHNFGGFNKMPTKNLWSPVDDHGTFLSTTGELE